MDNEEIKTVTKTITMNYSDYDGCKILSDMNSDKIEELNDLINDQTKRIIKTDKCVMEKFHTHDEILDDMTNMLSDIVDTMNHRYSILLKINAVIGAISIIALILIITNV